MARHSMGWKRQLPDARDYQFRVSPKVIARLAPTTDLAAGMGPQLDQGNLGSCGPNSAAEQIAFDEIKQGQPLSPASRLYIDYFTRLAMGPQYVDQDSGVDNRSMLKALNKYGYCPESMLPYSDDGQTFRRQPSQACIAAAQPNCITNYAAVAQTLDQLKGVLASGFTWLLGFDCYQQIMSDQAASNGILTMPRGNESPIGGHDVTACGYTDVDRPGVLPGNTWPAGTIKFRNHWMNSPGTPWGDGGYGYLPFQYAANSNLAGDYWVINAVAGVVVPPPGPTPPPPQPTPTLPTADQWNSEFALLLKRYRSHADQQTLRKVQAAGLKDLTAHLEAAASWPAIWAMIQRLARILGPAAIPLIEAYVATLPLTEVQRQMIDALLEALLAAQAPALIA